ncbi:MAG: ABC transporter substrate-binding protein, partial [Actinomycetia bacterium]|nr:ABC transporter substrate-binding protein [Actinomycetes bacterium]
PAALGKSFDIALSVPPLLISAAAEGIGIQEVAGATLNTRDNPQTFLVAPEGSDIKTVKDLEGKTLGVQTITGSTHLGTKMWLQKEGVPEDSVKIVQVDGPAQADQLKSGRIDAVETLAPFSTTILKLGESIIDPQAAIAPEVSGIFWTASPNWVSDNEEALDCYREGLDKAADFIENDEEAAKEVLKEQSGLPDDIVAETVLPTYTSDVRPDDLQKWLDAMKEVGGFEGDVDVDSLTNAG